MIVEGVRAYFCVYAKSGNPQVCIDSVGVSLSCSVSYFTFYISDFARLERACILHIYTYVKL